MKVSLNFGENLLYLYFKTFLNNFIKDFYQIIRNCYTAYFDFIYEKKILMLHNIIYDFKEEIIKFNLILNKDIIFDLFNKKFYYKSEKSNPIYYNQNLLNDLYKFIRNVNKNKEKYNVINTRIFLCNIKYKYINYNDGKKRIVIHIKQKISREKLFKFLSLNNLNNLNNRENYNTYSIKTPSFIFEYTYNIDFVPKKIEMYIKLNKEKRILRITYDLNDTIYLRFYEVSDDRRNKDILYTNPMIIIYIDKEKSKCEIEYSKNSILSKICKNKSYKIDFNKVVKLILDIINFKFNEYKSNKFIENYVRKFFDIVDLDKIDLVSILV